MSKAPDWPNGCPPAEAIDAEGLVSRTVRNAPPTLEDFKSYHELGLAPNANPCSRPAISVFNSRLNACHRLKLTPRLGTQVAEGTLKPEHGKMLLTSKQSGHIDWWPYAGIDRVEPFNGVRPCP